MNILQKQWRVTTVLPAREMSRRLDIAWSQAMLGPIRQVDAFHDILALVNTHAEFQFEEDVDILDYNDSAAKVTIQESIIRHRAERLMLKTKERAEGRAKKEEKVAEAIEQGILKPREIATFTGLPVRTVYRLKRDYLSLGRAGIQGKMCRVLEAERRLGEQAMAIKAVVEQVGTPFKSVSFIQARVRQRQPEEPAPSAKTTSSILKKCLRLSYRKLDRRTSRALGREHIERKRDVAKVLLSLDSLEYDIVAVDEFSVDQRLTRPYAWGRKGVTQFLATESRQPAWSCILAMSKRGLVHIKAQRGTVTAEVFVAYLKELRYRLRL
jgi:hypothetical protein